MKHYLDQMSRGKHTLRPRGGTALPEPCDPGALRHGTSTWQTPDLHTDTMVHKSINPTLCHLYLDSVIHECLAGSIQLCVQRLRRQEHHGRRVRLGAVVEKQADPGIRLHRRR